jgi:hypothetical protein
MLNLVGGFIKTRGVEWKSAAAYCRSLSYAKHLSSRTTPFYVHSSVNTADDTPFRGRMRRAPIATTRRFPGMLRGWFLNTVGVGFVVLTFGGAPAQREISRILCRPILVDYITNMLGLDLR